MGLRAVCSGHWELLRNTEAPGGHSAGRWVCLAVGSRGVLPVSGFSVRRSRLSQRSGGRGGGQRSGSGGGTVLETCLAPGRWGRRRAGRPNSCVSLQPVCRLGATRSGRWQGCPPVAAALPGSGLRACAFLPEATGSPERRRGAPSTCPGRSSPEPGTVPWGLTSHPALSPKHVTGPAHTQGAGTLPSTGRVLGFGLVTRSGPNPRHPTT